MQTKRLTRSKPHSKIALSTAVSTQARPPNSWNFPAIFNLSVDDAAPFEYLFNHCIVKTNGSNNEHFKEVLFTNASPSYRLRGGEKNKYRFDFRPDSLTTLGVGKADIFVTQQYPVDRYGVNRLTNDGPDIGAYEFVPKDDETN